MVEETLNLQECILKPSINSSAGMGVKCITTKEGIVQESGEPVIELLRSYCGKKIKNNQNLGALNPSSCNTLRVHTWRNREKDTIEFVSAFLRVGRAGAIGDNAFAGGIAIPVGQDGVLTNSGCLFKPYKRIEYSDTGVCFKGYQIDHIAEIIDLAKNAHTNLPYFDYIGWDITVDESENIIVVEFNPDSDMRLDQLIFLDTCLLEHQGDILSAIYK